MHDIAVRAENLGKLYKIGTKQERYKTLRDMLAEAFTYPLKRIMNSHFEIRNSQPEHIWALRDVSFEIRQGEVVGVIGRNGAGKSTLLKILSRITQPTRGYVEIQGRVGSLLEIGTGFHPELTGRENIYLNGAILGMKKREIDRKFDEIVSFAEVERFIDTPVKHYSSGMYMRLAFAVAAYLEPEILLVDEVLSVGDVGFQRKCLGKIGDVTRQGRTALFVSHNMAAIENLCSRAILLNSGEVRAVGPTGEVIEQYIHEVVPALTATPITDRTDRRGDGQIKFTGLHWENSKGEVVAALRTGEEYKLVLDYVCLDGISKDNVQVTFGVRDSLGGFLLLHQTNFMDHNFFGIPPRGRFICNIPKFPLVAGDYSMNIFVGIDEDASDLIEDAARITVEAGDFFGSGRLGKPMHCKILVDWRWEVEQLNRDTVDLSSVRREDR